MLDLTKSELLEIANWAMDTADRAMMQRPMNVYKYETAKAIFDKVHNAYYKMEG